LQGTDHRAKATVLMRRSLNPALYQMASAKPAFVINLFA
jgi:hypothetical protein